MLSNFTTFALRPRYVLPLADAPEHRTSQTIQLFMAEYPLFLSVVALSAALLFVNSLITGDDTTRIFSAAKQPTLLIMLVSGFFVVLFIEILFRYVLRV